MKYIVDNQPSKPRFMFPFRFNSSKPGTQETGHYREEGGGG